MVQFGSDAADAWWRPGDRADGLHERRNVIQSEPVILNG